MRFTAVIFSAVVAIISVSGQFNDKSANAIVASTSPTNSTQAEEAACFANCESGYHLHVMKISLTSESKVLPAIRVAYRHV